MVATLFISSVPPILVPEGLMNSRISLASSSSKLCNSSNTISINRKNLRFRSRASLTRNFQVTRFPTSVPVRVAHELLLAGHHYLDVRTPEEFSAGCADGAINIPYMYRLGSGMTNNLNFVEQVSSHFRKHDEIIVGCKSGKRSMMAAAHLLAAGFSGVTDINGGYDAWSQNGLPKARG